MKKFWKILLVALIVLLIGGLAYFLMQHFGLNNLSQLQQIIDNSFWGALIFFVILVLQVIFLPAGTLAFSASAVVLFDSPLKAWLLCWFGLAVGSWLMFWLGRIYGTKILKWIVGGEKTEKYASYLGQGKFVLPLILLVPVFPDDLICLAAGFSNVNWVYFMSIVFITRGIDNFCTVFIGASMLKSTVGIILLVIFVIAMIIASYFLARYKDQIENFFLKLFLKKKAQPEPSSREKVNFDEEKIEENNKNLNKEK